mgnify:CR=1 FL=1
MGVRGFVLARKGVLVSNPDVAKMTWTQWMFEYHSLRKKEEMLFKSSFLALRRTMVSVLGLNALRPTDEAGVPKKPEKMTEDELDQFMPLVSWVGRAELLNEISKQYETEAGIDAATNPDSEYERQVAAIDDADGDMSPIFSPLDPSAKFKDPRITMQEKLLVQQPTVEVDGKV